MIAKLHARQMTNTQFALLLLVPSLLIISMVIVFPLIYSLGLSFTNHNLLRPTMKFIGLKNYNKLMGSETYWQILGNTITISFFSVLGQTVIGMAVALLLNTGVKGVKVFRGLALTCWAVPALAAGILWLLIFNAEYGILNHILRITGIIKEFVPWLTHEIWAKCAVIITFIWRGTPFIMVMFLAALQTIPKDIIDSSKIDGAGAVRRFIHVTIPTIRPIIMIATLLQVIMIFQNFIIIHSITEGGPANGTKTLAIHVYEIAFDAWKMGRATAIGVTWLLILLIFSVFYMRYVGGKEQKIY
jgi:multiple sugar transport system permease protein